MNQNAQAASVFDLVVLSLDNDELYDLELNPLQATLIQSLGELGTPNGLVPAEKGFAYTIDRDEDKLYTIRISDGVVVNFVQLDADVAQQSRGFAVSPGGVMYGMFSGRALRTIDPSTGITTFVVVVGINWIIEGIAFGDDGTLYAVGNHNLGESNRLFSVDTTTGTATWIATLPVPDVDTLIFAPDGFLYGGDSIAGVADLYKIDPVSGSLTNLGATGITQFTGVMTVPSPPGERADVDDDIDVDGLDFSVFATCFNKAGNPPRIQGGCTAQVALALDFDEDGDIDGVDFSQFAQCYNKAGNPPRTLGCPLN